MDITMLMLGVAYPTNLLLVHSLRKKPDHQNSKREKWVFVILVPSPISVRNKERTRTSVTWISSIPLQKSLLGPPKKSHIPRPRVFSPPSISSPWIDSARTATYVCTFISKGQKTRRRPGPTSARSVRERIRQREKYFRAQTPARRCALLSRRFFRGARDRANKLLKLFTAFFYQNFFLLPTFFVRRVTSLLSLSLCELE